MSAQANTSGDEFRGDPRLVIDETEEQTDPELQEVVSDERRAELVEEGNIVAEVERERGENKSKGRGRKAAAAVVFLFVISAAAIGAWYVMKSGGKRQARVPVNRSSSASVAESEEALTKQAIEQANGAGPGITLSDGSVIRPSMPSPSPAARPVDSNIPVTQLPTKSNEELSGTVNSSKPTPNTEEKREGDQLRPAASGRNDERSVRISEEAKAEPNVASEREAAVANVVNDPDSVAVPGFGSRLPVKTLGVLYTLKSGGLARFELTQDVNGNGWSIPQGTVLIGALRGGEFDRAFVSLVGFIDTESGRFIKISGDLHGSDGAPGIRGKRRRMTSGWSRALSKLGDAGLGIAGAFAGSIGRRPIVINDAIGTSTGRVRSELDGRDRDSFVEVAAGSSGYMIITELEERSNFDQPPKSTGISDSELAELVQSGNRRRIREAMPRMTPEMRRIAEAVLNGDFAAR